ncbi:MAG: hypothetical protein AB7D27_01250 [Desulfomicrobium sp.]
MLWVNLRKTAVGGDMIRIAPPLGPSWLRGRRDAIEPFNQITILNQELWQFRKDLFENRS